MIEQIERHIYEDSRLTIEEQLYLYEKNPEKNERCSVLWHAWQQNKRWLSQLLELTVASFPAYSRHNESHAKAVLYNIEQILGEERIRKLGPTDCFALLHVVYIHDIGMVILSDDREKMVLSDEFAEMIDELLEDSNYELREAALELRRQCYKSHRDKTLIDKGGEEYLNEQKIIYQEKLHTYYALIQLMAEFQRGKHGDKANSRVTEWIGGQDKLRSEFAMSGIPMRIFLRIADCASLHTDWNFQHIMDLHYEEDGYVHDMLHPRFIAVMLQLGDALDIDNDRFHPFAQAFLGKFPSHSQAHYDKHMAIRTLKITPEDIVIEADCASRDAMRLVRNECDALERLLELASYHWATIAPRELSGALPTLRTPRLLLNGTEIPADLAMMRFQISQRKAFSILQGENIYSGRFPFVRELLQNAIDSTKIQCWTDYISSSKFRYKKEAGNKGLPSILELSEIVNPIEYPIEIEVRCGKKNEKNEWTEVDFSELDICEEKKEQYGILFSIRDYGTGISTEVLRDIAEVGTSYKKRKKKIRNIPEWLRPTGEFGIGLQSIFLVADSFVCETNTRKGERYRIEFRTGANGEHGYINVEPKDNEEDPMPFGTEFMVFICHDRKIKRDDFLEAWHGYDPFSENYEKDTIRRDIIELTSQLILDVEKQLGELLFPIYFHIGFNFEKFCNMGFKSKVKKLVLDVSDNFVKHNENSLRQQVSWIYNFKDNKAGFQKFDMNDGVCAFDFENMKLYMWLDNISTCAQLGVERVNIGLGEKEKLCQIFFKGIWAEETEISGDAELLERIDIKGGKMENNYLQLNRNGFTKKGKEHIENIIVPRILEGAKEALGIIALNAVDTVINNTQEGKKSGFGDIIGRRLKQTFDKGDGWKEQLLGFSLFYHYYMMYNRKKLGEVQSVIAQEKKAQWEKAMDMVIEVMKEKKTEIVSLGSEAAIANMSVPLLEIRDKKKYVLLGTNRISIADFFDHNNHFLIISKRRAKGAEWFNYLVQLSQSGENIIEKIAEPVYSEKEMNDRKCWLEEWGTYILENEAGIIGECTVEQSKLLQKLMGYVPVIGVFSSQDGNIRIHVLSGEPLEYIYYDKNSKFFHLQKMLERHKSKNAVRFVSFPWFEFQTLKIKKIPDEVCDCREAYFCNMEYRMLFPFSGEALEKVFSNYQNITMDFEMQKLGEDLKNICNFSFEYFVEQNIFNQQTFNEFRKEYCKEQKRPYNQEQFLRVLKLGYRLVLTQNLQKMMVNLKKTTKDGESRSTEEETRMLSTPEELRETQNFQKITKDGESCSTEEETRALSTPEELRETQNLQKMMKDGESCSTEEETRTLPTPEELRETVINIIGANLDNLNYIIRGGIQEDGEENHVCQESIRELLRWCIEWEKKYREELEKKISCIFNKVKDQYWERSIQKKLMIDWTVQTAFQEEDIVCEMYGNLWGDVQEVLNEGWNSQNDNLNDWEILNMIRESRNGNK